MAKGNYLLVVYNFHTNTCGFPTFYTFVHIPLFCLSGPPVLFWDPDKHPKIYKIYICCSVASCIQLFVNPWTVACQASLSITVSWACSNSRPSNRWYHPTISFSVVPFSSCLQSFPASGSFPMSQLFASGGQRIGDSASASVLPMNIQGWFPWGLSGLISLVSKELSRVFSNFKN